MAAPMPSPAGAAGNYWMPRCPLLSGLLMPGALDGEKERLLLPLIIWTTLEELVVLEVYWEAGSQPR